MRVFDRSERSSSEKRSFQVFLMSDSSRSKFLLDLSDVNGLTVTIRRSGSQPPCPASSGSIWFSVGSLIPKRSKVRVLHQLWAATIIRSGLSSSHLSRTKPHCDNLSTRTSVGTFALESEDQNNELRRARCRVVGVPRRFPFNIRQIRQQRLGGNTANANSTLTQKGRISSTRSLAGQAARQTLHRPLVVAQRLWQ